MLSLLYGPTLTSVAFPGGSAGKESTCNVGDLGSIPGWEDLLKKGMATHPSPRPQPWPLAIRAPLSLYSRSENKL